ncbi:uncharacterized protein LOC143585853 [Bidens hawaiensis]|uniref:uncharacterized protein LOC143585853 n=1 Tax=Bidens hawaiensis TaxID=980011 RepID=UPI00404B08ED
MAPLQRSKSASQTGQLQIQHFIHHHVLHKLYMTAEFNCDGCNTGGFGVRYHCSACDFDLHEQCATAPHRIATSIHPHHHLVLVNRPGDSHLCHVCKGVTNGLCYTCEIGPACEFNVHAICIQIPSLTGDKSLTLANNNNINQPVLINHQQQQPMQLTHSTSFGGYSGVANGQPVMVNHQQLQLQQQQMQAMHTASFGGYNNNSQHMMTNHYQQQQQKQGMMATTSFGGYHGMNNNNINQTPVINHHQHQQVMPTTSFGGGMNTNSQPVMANHHQQQPQLMPTTSFNANQQFMTNHHQQVQQPPTAVGGYQVVNNNQTVMISHPPPPPPPPPPQQSNGYTKVGKIAANILSTSIIGVPLFMSK